MKKWLPLVALLFVLPVAVHAGKNDEKNTVIVEINTSKGPKPITLTRKGDGFVGPRGEYYPKFPTKATLAAVYGSATPTPKPSATPKEVVAKGDYKVVVLTGGLNIRRDGKLVSEVRTAKPNVTGWKFVRDYSQIVTKSNRNGEPGLVELFDVKSGKRLEKVLSTDVKDGKPAWAKNFAE